MQPAPGRHPRAGIVIPLRAFGAGKARLADRLSEPERAALVRRLATRVLAAAEPLPVVVVSGDDDVRGWATAAGASVIDDPGRGLDAAVAAGVDAVRVSGAVRTVVAHADLARIRPGQLLALAVDVPDRVTIVPDHRDDGTPVISVPNAMPFAFSYGPGSFRRHAAAARTQGYAVRVVRDQHLGTDIDVPADLDLIEESPA